MIEQPFDGIVGVIFEPTPGGTKPKTVSPGIHVLHESNLADASDLVREKNLQIANGRLLEIVPTGVTIEIRAALLAHANRVARLMQQGMHWCVGSNEYTTTYNTRFTVAPKRPCDRPIGRLHDNRQTKTIEQRLDRCR